MPVKCTTPPLVLTTRPPSRSRAPSTPPSRGRRAAARGSPRAKPGRRRRVGVEEHAAARRCAARAPAFAPAAKPTLRAVSQHDAPRARARARRASVPSRDALSTTTSSSPRPSCATSAGSDGADGGAAVVRDDHDRQARCTRPGHRGGMLASAPAGRCSRHTARGAADDRNLGAATAFQPCGPTGRHAPTMLPVDARSSSAARAWRSCPPTTRRRRSATWSRRCTASTRRSFDVARHRRRLHRRDRARSPRRRRARAAAAVQPRHRRRRAGRLQVRRRERLRLHGPGRRRRPARPGRDREADRGDGRAGPRRHDLRLALRDRRLATRARSAAAPASTCSPSCSRGSCASPSPIRRRASGSTTAARSRCSRATTRTTTPRSRRS